MNKAQQLLAEFGEAKDDLDHQLATTIISQKRGKFSGVDQYIKGTKDDWFVITDFNIFRGLISGTVGKKVSKDELLKGIDATSVAKEGIKKGDLIRNPIELDVLPDNSVIKDNQNSYKKSAGKWRWKTGSKAFISSDFSGVIGNKTLRWVD